MIDNSYDAQCKRNSFSHWKIDTKEIIYCNKFYRKYKIWNPAPLQKSSADYFHLKANI